MRFSVNVTGEADLYKRFEALPKATRNRAVKPALLAGAKIIRKAASANVKRITAESKVATGTLASGIAAYGMRAKKGMLRAGVMVRKGLVNKRKIINGKPVRVGLYASVLEYGKSNQPPRSWLRKAAVESESSVVIAVRDVLAGKLAALSGKRFFSGS